MADRRSRRRQETIAAILDLAIEVMAADGVGALTMAGVARRLGVQPPSLYKYFPSRLALYDALFERGQREHLAALRDGIASAEPGTAAIREGLAASAEWGMRNQELNQLLFWRPVPGYQPSEEAFAPSVAMITALREQLARAVERGEVGPAAATDEGVRLLSILNAGMLSQQMANEPEADFATGSFTRELGRLVEMFVRAYPRA